MTPLPAANRITRTLGRIVRCADLCGSALPASATFALPGTEEKVRAMIERAGQRTSLFHPDDLTTEDATALGLSFTVAQNGTAVWFRPADLLQRRQLVLDAQSALSGERAPRGA